MICKCGAKVKGAAAAEAVFEMAEIRGIVAQIRVSSRKRHTI
jgi:hypothetical protein